jgi:hypothetical protein
VDADVVTRALLQARLCVHAGVCAGEVRVSASAWMFVTSLASLAETDIEVALGRWGWVGI